MKSDSKRLFAAFAVFAMMFSAAAFCISITDESDAIYSSSATVGEYYTHTFRDEMVVDPIEETIDGQVNVDSVTCDTKQSWTGSSSLYGLSGSARVISHNTTTIVVELTVSGTPTQAGMVYVTADMSYYSENEEAPGITGYLITAKIQIDPAPVVEKKTHTLSFNANQGTGAPNSVTKTSSSNSCSITIPSTTPTRSGYTFLGWAESSGATDATYSAGQNVTVSGTKTLYAVWEKKNTGPTLPDGVSSGSGTQSDPYVFDLRVGNNYNLTVPAVGQFTSYGPVGHHVMIPGMNFQCNGKTIYDMTESVGGQLNALKISGTPEYNGTWTILASNPMATKYYEINVTGGENYFEIVLANVDGSNFMTLTGHSSSSSYSFSISQNHGSKQIGWSYREGSTTSDVNLRGPVTVNFGEFKTLYPVMGQTFSASLRYDANGGTNVPAVQKEDYFGAVAAGSHPFTISNQEPTRTGFTFLGWATDRNAHVQEYVGNETINVKFGETTTLYAVWKEITTRYYAKLQYDANGGIDAPPEEFTSQVAVKPNGSATFDIINLSPTWEGHTFIGWSEDRNASDKQYVAYDEVTVNFGETKVLYAVWKDDMKTFTATLKFDLNGGTGTFADMSESKNAVTATGHATFRIPLDREPVKENSEFKGWSETKNGTVKFTTGSQVPVDFGKTKTIYAVYEDYTVYEAILIYNSNGGTNGPSPTIVKKAMPTAEGNAEVTVTSKTPTNGNSKFLGWATSKSAKIADYRAGDSVTIPYNQSKTVYAVWEKELVINGEPEKLNGLTGNRWSYTVDVNAPNATVKIEGADWLHSNGLVLSGTPSESGDFNVKITVSATGYSDVTQNFQIHIVKKLNWENEPTTGAIIYAV